ELIEEEELVLVRTPAGAGHVHGPDYVHVDWGPQFAATRGLGPAAFGEPGPMVGLGPLGLSYILRAGGMGYFRKGAVKPHLDAGELERVDGAPQFTYPAYAVFPEEAEARDDVQEALRGLKAVTEAAT